MWCFASLEEGAHAAPLIIARSRTFTHPWNVLLLLFVLLLVASLTWCRVDLVPRFLVRYQRFCIE